MRLLWELRGVRILYDSTQKDNAMIHFPLSLCTKYNEHDKKIADIVRGRQWVKNRFNQWEQSSTTPETMFLLLLHSIRYGKFGRCKPKRIQMYPVTCMLVA